MTIELKKLKSALNCRVSKWCLECWLRRTATVDTPFLTWDMSEERKDLEFHLLKALHYARQIPNALYCLRIVVFAALKTLSKHLWFCQKRLSGIAVSDDCLEDDAKIELEINLRKPWWEKLKWLAETTTDLESPLQCYFHIKDLSEAPEHKCQLSPYDREQLSDGVEDTKCWR